VFTHPIVDSPLIAHRGASAYAPENTIAAVELAAKQGARWIETDVRLTADYGLVMIHDPTLDRTSDGEGPIIRTEMDVIRGLDGGSWFSEAYGGEKIPDLRTFLQAVLDCGLSLQLELKENTGLEEPLVEGVVATLQRIWPVGDRGLYLSSFSERCMRLSAASLPEVPRCLATEFTPADPATRLREAECQILHVQADVAGASELALLRETTMEFAVATVNDRAQAESFLRAGATAVLTDFPDLLST
jgi:glycerophosphoryl diester phosphodiesterase